MLKRIMPAIFSSLLLGAHFSRSEQLVFVCFCLLAPLLFVLKKKWVLIVFQIYLYLGAIIWIDTIVKIARIRLTEGTDWARMAVILGVLVLFTVFSGILLNTSKLKEKYKY